MFLSIIPGKNPSNLTFTVLSLLEDLNPIFVSEDDVFIQGGALSQALKFLVGFLLFELFFGVFDFLFRGFVCFDVFEFPDLGVLDVVSRVGDQDHTCV